MTSAGAGEKSVQDTHIHRAAYKELLGDDGGGRTHMHTRRVPFLPSAASSAENQKIFALRPSAGVDYSHC
jgi:hypothetical protein